MKGDQKLFLIFLFVMGLLLSGCRNGNSQKEGISTPVEPSQIAFTSPETAPVVTSSPTVLLSPTISVSSTGSNDCKKIAFTMINGTNFDIYTVCPDGSSLINLTHDPSNNSHPAWSPDGKKIAFASTRDGISQIYIMDENGSNPIKLTSDHQNDFPIWRPNGSQIAFRTFDGKGLWWWRIVEINSQKISQFSEPSFDFFFQTPAWSADGQTMAYMSLVEQKQRNDGSSQIHIKNLVDSSDTALTHDSWANINPVWSPDGTKLAFFSKRDGNHNMYALYIMNKDGTGNQQLTQPVYGEELYPSWSPDGQQIVIGSNAPHVAGIYIIDINTGNSRSLLFQSKEMTSEPSWQP
jgi:TolB protein